MLLRYIYLVGISLGLVACSAEPEPHPQPKTKDAQTQVLQELKSKPIQAFAATPDDAHDIQQLLNYEQNFQQNMQAMEDELAQLQSQDQASEQFIAERQRDNIQSALSMLRHLDLKTAQGRYIQSLLAQYWQGQKQASDAQHSNAKTTEQHQHVKDLGLFIHAQEQLEHWQQQTQHAAKSTPSKSS